MYQTSATLGPYLETNSNKLWKSTYDIYKTTGKSKHWLFDIKELLWNFLGVKMSLAYGRKKSVLIH